MNQIKVSEIKKGMLFLKDRHGEFKYRAESDAYTRDNVWCVDIGDDYRYGFTQNPNDLIEVANPIYSYSPLNP